MSTASSYLAWTLVLAVAQIMAAAAAKRTQDGTEWATGTRDGAPPQYHGYAARLVRAQANLYEALPLFIGAVLLAHETGRDNTLTSWGAGLFFWARLFYVPAYSFGLTPWRSIVWGVSLLGLAAVLISLV